IFIAGIAPTRAFERAVSAHNLNDVQHLDLSEQSLTDIAKLGLELSDDVVEAARQVATLDSTATVVYTSGTTGKPKGTKISHRNLAEGALNIVAWAHDIVFSNPHPRLLMFLPLAHILARAVQ